MDILVYSYILPSVRRRSFVQRLDEINRNDHNVVVVSAGSEVQEENNLEIWKVPQLREEDITWFLNALLYIVFGLWYGIQLHREHSFDLVRGDFADVPGFTAALFSTVARLPFILYCHGRVHFDHPAGEPVGEKTPYRVLGRKDLRHWLAKAAISRAEAVHVVSDLYGGVLDCETETVYPAVDPDLFTPSGDVEEVIVSVGQLREVKNLETAIRAAEQEGKEWQYVVIGDGPVRRDIEEQAEDVRFTGGAGTETVAECLGEARVFLLPSRYETFGVAYLEALAAGTPIICGRNTGIAEVIEDGVHGRIVNPEDVEEIAEAISSIDDSFEEMSDAARTLAESFSVEQSASELVGRYEELLEEYG